MTALPLNAWLVPFVAALVAAGLAVFILLRPWAEAFHRRVALALGLTALVEAAGAALLFLPSDAVFFRQVGLSFEFLRMAAIFLAGAALIGRSSAEADPGVQRRSWIAVLVGLAGAAWAWWGAFVGIDEMTEGAGLVRLGVNGRLLHVAMLLGLVLALAQLESVLRASRDPFRFRIKFVILGLCALAGFELYVTSQTLLLGAWRVHHALLSGIAALVSVGLVAFGLGRMRLARTLGRVSVSSQALYGSFTLLGVGLYLLGVGLLGEALRLSGRTLSVGATELAVFVVTLALVAARLVARRALALPRPRVAPPAALALRLPHEVARGDGRVPWRRVGRAGARPAARRAGAHVRRRRGCRSSCATTPTTASTRCARSTSRRRRDPIAPGHPVVAALASVDEPTELVAPPEGDDASWPPRARCSGFRCAGPASSSGSSRSGRAPPGRATTWTTATCCARSRITPGCCWPTRGWRTTGRPRPSSTP